VRHLLRHLVAPDCLTELLQAFHRYQGYYKRTAYYLEFFAENEPKAKSSLRYKKFGRVSNLVCYNLLQKLTLSIDSVTGYLRNYSYIDIFINCNWVVTRWQQYSTHLHTNNTQNDTKQTIHRTTRQFGRVRAVPRLG